MRSAALHDDSVLDSLLPQNASMMKRVLIVTYDFPPVGGVSVQRVAKFAKYLPRHGWQPTVLTTRRGRIGPQDRSLFADLPAMPIHRTPAPDPVRLLVALKALFTDSHRPDRDLVGPADGRVGPWHPAAWVIPDAKLPWIPFGLHWAARVPRNERGDVVLSTLPSPTAAILGHLIARMWGAPHVIDYRESWSNALYLPRRLHPLRWLETRLERAILTHASAAVAVPGVRHDLPNYGTPVCLIPNGYDETDFARVAVRKPSDQFVIAHVGVMWQGREVDPLIPAVNLLARRNERSVARLHFLQVGRTDSYSKRRLEALSTRTRVSVLPAVDHSDALAYMIGADLLYLPTIRNYIPTKSYEYVRSGVPIVGVGHAATNLAGLLRETGTGQVFDPEDAAGIAAYIDRLVNRGRRPPGPPSPAVAAYSREANTGRLAALLDEVLVRRSVRRAPLG